MLLVFRKLLKMIFCPTVFPLSQIKKREQGKCLAKVMSRAEEGEGWGGPFPFIEGSENTAVQANDRLV